MKRNTARSRTEERARTKPRSRRPARVQRGRALPASAALAGSFTRWATSYPWDGQRLGTGLVDTSQLACECGECRGCQQRLG